MSTITLNKNEYELLRAEADAYHKLASVFAASQLEKSVEDVVANFKQTKKYSRAFLRDLKDGLYDLRSSKA